MDARGERRTHHVQVPIVLRTIDDQITAVQQFREMLSVADVGERGPRDPVPELMSDVMSAPLVEISDNDRLHFARDAKVIDHRPPHQSRT